MIKYPGINKIVKIMTIYIKGIIFIQNKIKIKIKITI